MESLAYTHGTFCAACCLVALGMTTEEADHHLRNVCPHDEQDWQREHD